MKFKSQKGQQGNTLIITLFFCALIGMVLLSTLKLTSARHANTVRSNDWNQDIPVLEAGIEEAMTHLHDDTSPSANGWTPTSVGGQTVYTKQRTFSDGSYFYVAIYDATSNAPVIYSQGYVRAPLKNTQYISRMVRVNTTNSPTVFTKAVATTGSITLSGGSWVDGFDSRIGGYSTSTNRSATGALASDSTGTPAIRVGTGSVYGRVTTGPGGSISSSGGSVGDVGWNSGFETGWTNNNMNVAFPTNSPPTGGFLLPQIVTSGGYTVTYLTNNSYQVSSFSTSSSSQPMVVAGHVTLWVTGPFTIQNGGLVYIMPGASFTMYVGGPTTISGGGVINATGLASNFSLIGLSSCTNITYSGNASFIGTINAPQADLAISSSADSYGAAIAKTVTISGGAAFHYDNALGASGTLIATSWQEL